MNDVQTVKTIRSLVVLDTWLPILRECKQQL